MRFLKTALLGVSLLIGAGALAQDQVGPGRLPVPLSPGPAMAGPSAVPTDVPGSHALTKGDVDSWLDGYLPYALRSADIPGAVAVVVKDGQVLTARGFGYADLAKKTPVDPDRTLFRPGSVSKLFTWTAAMQMVEQGKLNLDGDVNAYLDFKIPPFQGKPVTLRQLMTHTGGFEEAGRGVVFFDPKNAVTLEQYLKHWVPKRIFAPGSTPAYSNWATALAAYLVQRVSGEEFDGYLERHIFAPLGMRNSTFRQPLPAALAAQMATAYPTPGQAKGFEYVGPAPAGSASISGTDMARFMIAHLNHGAGLMRPETADMMHDSPLDHVNPMSLIPPLNRMELGFFQTNLNGRDVIGHLGDTEAFHSSLHLFMKEGVGLYVSFNSPGKGGAVQSLRTAVFEDFADRYFPDVSGPEGRVDARTSAEHARMMAGRWIPSRRADSSFFSALYWLTGQADVTVGPKGELVVPSVTNAGGRPRQWVEVAPFVWHDAYGHDRLAAKVVNGQVVRWSFELAAPFEVFDRVPASRNAGWLLPALLASIAILLLTFLYWPAAFLVRRHYKAPAPLSGRARGVHRANRSLAGLTVLLVVGWAWCFSALLGGAEPGSTDGVVRLLELAGIVVFFGAVLISAWNVWLTWTDGRRWPRKLWSLLVFVASLILLYVAVTFHLVTPTVNY